MTHPVRDSRPLMKNSVSSLMLQHSLLLTPVSGRSLVGDAAVNEYARKLTLQEGEAGGRCQRKWLAS